MPALRISPATPAAAPCAACPYEFALFATLAARRLQLPHRVVVVTWWIGMGTTLHCTRAVGESGEGVPVMLGWCGEGAGAV